MRRIAALLGLIQDQILLAFFPAGRALSAVATLGLIVLWFLVPRDRCLVRADLLPWLALCASLVLALQGDRLGEGPHPQLPQRSSDLGQLALRAAAALVPQVLLKCFDLGAAQAGAARTCLDATSAYTDLLLPSGGATLEHQGTLAPTLMILTYGALIAGLKTAARDEGRTGWRPPHPHPLAYGLARALGLVIAAVSVWAMGRLLPDDDGVALVGAATLASASFVSVGLLWERPQDAAQRSAMRRRATIDRSQTSVAAGLDSWLLALVLPAAGICLLQLLDDRAQENQATIACSLALYLPAIAMVVWPAPRHVGTAALLHQVEPTGQATATAPTDAGADTTPPKGTFSFDPQRVRRVGVSVPWLVPAQAALGTSRLLGSEPLWLDRAGGPLEHVIGRATMPTLDGLTWGRRVEIELLVGDDLAPLAPGDSQERRLVIYTPDPLVVDDGQPRWGFSRPPGSDLLQEVDPSTRQIVLVDGAIIILGSGLVSQLYEVELGAPLTAHDVAPNNAAPQLQDHEAP